MLGLRTLTRRRSLGSRNWLRPVGLGPVGFWATVRLDCGWTARLGTIRLRPIVRLCRRLRVGLGPLGFWASVRLDCGWTVRLITIRFRPVARLDCWGTIGLGTIRFWPIVRRRLLGANGIVLRMRSRLIRRWLDCGPVGRTGIGRPCLFGWYDCAVVKRSRLRSSCYRWRAMVHRSS